MMSDLGFYYDTISTRRSTVNHHKLEHKRVLRIGVTQLILGILCAMCGVFSLVASMPAWEVFYLTSCAPGVWVGVLAFITGLFSVNSSRSLQRKQFMMRGFTFMTILTLVAVFVMIGLVVADLVTVVKAELRFDYEINELKEEAGSADNISCLNLTLGDWLAEIPPDPITTKVPPTTTISMNTTIFETTNSTDNFTGAITATEPTTMEHTTFNSSDFTTNVTSLPTTTFEPPVATPKQDEILRCIARSTFQQKFVIDSLLIFLAMIESILLCLSLYIIYEIHARFKKESGAANFDRSGNRVVLELPGSTMNNNEYCLSNGHTVPVPKSIIQHSIIPQNDSFPDSDEFRSHLEMFDSGAGYGSTS